MTLDEIQTAALGLYRHDSPDFLRGVLSDALSENGKTWAEFLESSGTLERLAECMVAFSEAQPLHEYFLALSSSKLARANAPVEWLKSIRWDLYTDRMDASHEEMAGTRLEQFTKLCAAFGVPPVMIEVGTPNMLPGAAHRRTTALYPDETVWSAPSTELALATLREAMDQAEGYEAWNERMLRMDAAVRAHHPQATSWRVRLGAAEWTERMI